MNGERTETFLPGIHRADYILRQRCLMTFPKWSLFTRFVCSSCQPYRFRFPTVIHFIFGLHPAIHTFSSIFRQLPFDHIGFVLLGIIFLRSYLGFVKLQGVSCEQSSFRQRVLKAYSSRQSCLICPIRTSESRKIFPSSEGRKA